MGQLHLQGVNVMKSRLIEYRSEVCRGKQQAGYQNSEQLMTKSSEGFIHD